jgi:tetratricopeptide (TPR) repeat protein
MQPAALQSQKSPIEEKVIRVRGLLEKRQFEPALGAAEALLLEVPENRDVWYLRAVAQRYLGRIADALETLARLQAIHPAYSRLFQERGYCHLAAHEPEAAIEAFLRAVNLNPALPGSWKALSVLFKAAGRAQEAGIAASHVEKLASLPPQVVTASSMFADGEIHAAEQVVRRFLQVHGDHIEGMRLLAQIGMKLDVFDDAEFLLESVLVFAPDYHLARHDYVNVLLRLHKHAKALQQVETLLSVEPRNRAYRIDYANAAAGVGRHEEALRAFRELLAEAPGSPDLHLSVAHALKTLGRQKEAIESYRAAAAARPSFGDAWWSLANLKTYRFADAELARMREQEATPTTGVVDRYHLCFALGKALEDSGQFAESFFYYERGNALKKSETRYEAASIERTVRLQIESFDAEFFSARRNAGCDRPDPIFIVGLPRAGSTLIEQILASHSQVEGTHELADVPRIAALLQGRNAEGMQPGYPAILARTEPERLKQLGEKYLADTQAYRTGKPFFIDKNPNNFRHIALIHLMLPNARIIDARREPMACCFSNFKQLFAAGQEFTYSLEDIARYYRLYVELMAHWDRALPGRILRVQHEDVVADLEGSVRRLLEYCGLPFEPQCLEFYRTERSVRTASSEQVRQPIFREGLDQWRHYEPWLGPLKAGLGDLLADR